MSKVRKTTASWTDRLVGWPVIWILNGLGKLSWDASWKLGGIAGRMLYRLDVRHRRIAMENLCLAYGSEAMGEKARRDLTRKAFENVARLFLETAKIPGLKGEELQDRFELERGEILKEAYEEGKGVIVICAHLGNWEIMARTFGSLGYRYAVIYRTMDNLVLDEKMRETRMVGGEIIRREEMFKSVRGALKEGKIVAFMSDQNAGKKGVFVPFFGIQASTTPAPAIFAQATGAPIIPVFCYRKAPGRFLAVVHSAIRAKPGRERRDEQLELTEAFTLAIERAVRRHPEQWFWMHRRWRTRPPEERT